MAQVAYLQSYARLRQHGVFTHLEHFVFSSSMSKQDGDHLISEVDALLEADEKVLDAMMAISEPSLMAYRHAQAQMYFCDKVSATVACKAIGDSKSQPIVLLYAGLLTLNESPHEGSLAMSLYSSDHDNSIRTRIVAI